MLPCLLKAAQLVTAVAHARTVELVLAACPAPLPAVCGFVLEKTGSFTLIFQTTAALYVLGTIVWNAACSAERQF